MRYLNKEMLDVIIAVLNFQDFVIADNAVRQDAGLPARDHFAETENYYFSLPDAVLRKAGLHKNRADLEDILRFEVTDQMTSTSFEDLGRFPFTVDYRNEFGSTAIQVA